MAEVTLTRVTKTFGEFVAVNDVSMVIEDGKFTVLVGPSGCGKTTTLRMVAGLEEATSGEIRIGDRVVNDVPPKDRDIAMVFQNYALYPHMDVFNNMAFGLKLRKYPKEEIKRRVNDAAAMLGIEAKLKSKPRELSGGQRQRVAVMKDGVIHQYAPPQDTYDHPANQFVAGFIGSPAMNFLSATVARENGSVILSGRGFHIDLPVSSAVDLPEHVVVGIRPEDLDGPASSGDNAIAVKVTVKEQLGHSLLVYGDAGDAQQVVASLDPHRRVEIDEDIFLQVNLKTIHIFHSETQATLV